MEPKLYKTKQMGDACEMLVAAEMTLAGMPAMKMPDNWPCYDLIAQHQSGGTPQRISVKSRTFKGENVVEYKPKDEFDWLAIVLLPGEGQLERRIFIVPRDVADAQTLRPKSKQDHVWYEQDKIPTLLAEFENNFCLLPKGRSGAVLGR
jgi:hypothetical protein